MLNLHNIISADDLAPQETLAAIDVVSTKFTRNISGPAGEG